MTTDAAQKLLDFNQPAEQYVQFLDEIVATFYHTSNPQQVLPRAELRSGSVLAVRNTAELSAGSKAQCTGNRRSGGSELYRMSNLCALFLRPN